MGKQSKQYNLKWKTRHKSNKRNNPEGRSCGSETGQMVLDTGKLTTEDIKDKDYSDASGFSVGTTIGSSSNGKDKNKFPTGSTNLSMQNEGSEKEQTTMATIGAGKIIVAGQEKTELENVNRDLNNTQITTKDQITGALNAN
jgi:hypothetical protein